MSVVRLEVTVPDGQAADVANELAARYLDGGVFVPRPVAVVVSVRTDAEALRDRTIMAALRYFLPEA